MSRYRELNPGTMLCPNPVVLVSCAEKGNTEKRNLITVAWVGTVNSEPPMLSVSIRPERYSHHMIAECGEFVVNLPDRKMCRQVDFCGVKSGRNMDKAAECGLKYRKAAGMSVAPAVDNVPLSLSCAVRDVLHLGSHDMFIGEIVAAEVREDILDEKGTIRIEKAGLICYNHGLYQQLGSIFGFFGYSIAKQDVFERRMKVYR